jgi:hypothetical protein
MPALYEYPNVFNTALVILEEKGSGAGWTIRPKRFDVNDMPVVPL